jgi:hypothetical protein
VIVEAAADCIAFGLLMGPSRIAICEANSIGLLYRLVLVNITWRALTKVHETNTQKQERDPNSLALYFGSVFKLCSEGSKVIMIKGLCWVA